MRYVRLKKSALEYYGVAEGNAIKVLNADIFAKEKWYFTGEIFERQAVKLLSPCRPSKIICIGKNYRDHAAELDSEVPEEPIVFLKPPTGIIAPGEEILLPPQSKRVDYEGELAVIIAKKAKNVSQEDARQYIFGYTCANDVTARDLQVGQWTVAKGFDTFCPLGPEIVTEIDADNLQIKTILNGRTKQEGNTNDMVFKIPFLIAYLSHIMTLLPGDVILTGTPSGIGPMNSGDQITVEIEGIGSLTNNVI